MMNVIINLFLFLISFSKEEITTKFSRTIFISNQKSKVISVSINGINSYINLYSTLNEKDYSICKNISYSLFVCELNGIYSFKYNYRKK